LEKRIEQVKFQTNILAKQSHLFAIYGNAHTLSPDGRNVLVNNVSIETLQPGIELDEIGPYPDKKGKRLWKNQRNGAAHKPGESKMSHSETPSKMGNNYTASKGSASGIKEQYYEKQNSNVSRFSRNSEIEYNKAEIREEDQDTVD
jgi:hypothetical protein